MVSPPTGDKRHPDNDLRWRMRKEAMSVTQKIHDKLTAALSPQRLDVIDDSHRHEGHAGHDGRGESHFRILIVSDLFAGLSRIDRQRLVHEILASELQDRVHALSMRTLTSEEAAGRQAG